MVITATDLRVGNIVEYQNALWRVMQVVHVTPGNWRGMVQTKLRNLKSGTQTEHRFRSEDNVERVTLQQHEMEYLYESDGRYTFMNTETYDQIELDRELLGEAINYLIPNHRIEIEFSQPVTTETVMAAPGTRDVLMDGRTALITVEGSAAGLFRLLGPMGIERVRTHEADLEDIFLSHYQES